MKVQIQMITPFSNGTEADCWLSDNCEQCVKAYRPKNGIMPDYEATYKLINLGMECKFKLHIDYGFVSGEIPLSIAEQIGYTEEKGFPANCLHFSDDDKDKWKPQPRKPKDAPDCQMCLPFAINEIVLNKELVTV